MKAFKELKLEDLNLEQKIGMTMCGHAFQYWDEKYEEANLQYALDMIKNHSLGAIWVDPTIRNFDKVIERINEAAEYPILIFTDAENGLGDNKIGAHSAIAMTDSEELAYIFGKVTGTRARKAGYNVVCNPVVDICQNNSPTSTMRSMGSNKERIARLAAAEIRGMHDAGILSICKHYPSAHGDGLMDSHMAESLSMENREELLECNLYAYLELLKEELLDGIMTGHCRLPSIDPENPASLSEKVIDIIREQGFEGIAITDALNMMGVVAKYGKVDCNGLSVQNGNDLALTWNENEFCYNAMLSCYERGILTEDKLDVHVRRVLAAQHKLTLFGECPELTKREIELYNKINTDGVCAITDEGLECSIDKNGKHFIALQVPVGGAGADGKISEDSFTTPWYKPQEIIKQLEETFPNSKVYAMDEFPTSTQNHGLLTGSLDYDDVIIISFIYGKPYQGVEEFSSRFVTVVRALQITGRVSAVLHCGNPYPLEALDHIPRIIMSGASAKAVETGIKVLAGDYPANGKLIFDLKLK